MRCGGNLVLVLAGKFLGDGFPLCGVQAEGQEFCLQLLYAKEEFAVLLFQLFLAFPQNGACPKRRGDQNEGGG